VLAEQFGNAVGQRAGIVRSRLLVDDAGKDGLGG
jgi:hypothetical protein